MNVDALQQLTEARTGIFHNQHPVIMSLLWRPLDRLIPGPWGILIFHCALFWGGLLLFGSALSRKSSLAPTLVLAIGFSPPLLTLLRVICKDIGMGVALLFASAALLHCSQTRSRWAAGAGVVALWYGFSVRFNAFFAVLPLAYWASAVALKKGFGRRSLKLSLVLTVLLVGSFSLATSLVTRKLAQKQLPLSLHAILQCVWIHDLSALSLSTQTLHFPPYLIQRRAGRDLLDQISKAYDPSDVLSLMSWSERRVSPRFTTTPNRGEAEALFHTWVTAVLKHPGAYLAHRARVFSELIGWNDKPACGINTGLWQNSILYKGIFYGALLGVLMAFAQGLRWKFRREICLLGASGLLNLLPLFFLTGSCHVRYTWWTVLAAHLVACLAASEVFDLAAFPLGFTKYLKSLTRTPHPPLPRPVDRKDRLIPHPEP